MTSLVNSNIPISSVFKQIMTVGYSIKQCEIISNAEFIINKEQHGLRLPNSLQTAATLRKCEFLAGRYCSIEAMKDLGIMNPVQPSIGKHREPLWPPGITGSISHHKHLAIAIVTNEKISGLGIDIETWILPDIANKIFPLIIDNNELSIKPSSWSQSEFLTTLFSAKESLFKAMFPQINQYIDFHDASLTSIDLNNNQLEFALNRTLSKHLTKGLRIKSNIKMSSGDVKTVVCLH